MDPTARESSTLVLNALPFMVSFVGADERHLFVNAAYEKRFGSENGPLLGQTLQSILGEKIYAGVQDSVRRALAGESVTFEQAGVQSAPGVGQDLRVQLCPHRGDDGKVDGFVFVLDDVSVARRSYRDELLSVVSHELRTPLNSILGWAQLLRDGQLDARAALRAVETIERNAKAQLRLVEDILDDSRIIEGKLQLENRPLALTEVVREGLDAVLLAAQAKQIQLSVNLDPAAAHLTGDAERLQQVVWNLANNAIKFTPNGGRVDVTLKQVGRAVELAIADSGQGIEPAFLPHVFERFRQAERGVSRRHGGLGLGLALVRHVVEAHGGTVTAESAGPGRGSRFVVLLPAQPVIRETVD